MREPGVEPQFDRLITNLERAKKLWREGDYDTPPRLLKLIASIALSEIDEYGPYDARAE